MDDLRNHESVNYEHAVPRTYVTLIQPGEPEVVHDVEVVGSQTLQLLMMEDWPLKPPLIPEQPTKPNCG